MSKRAPYTYGVDKSDRRYWKSVGEFAQTSEFKDALEREFPDGASELTDDVSRRSFIGLMGASLGLAGLSGCRRPEEKIVTYTKRPESLIPGAATFFATALPFANSAIGVLAESHEGRPTKIEGNPDHPDSLGAANIYAQATVLDLYDVQRLHAPEEKGAPKTWADAASFLKSRGDAARAKGGAGLAILTEGHRSPTLAAQLAKVQADLPGAKVVRYETFSRDNVREGSRLAFGRALEPVIDLAKAKVIVAIDSDLFFQEADSIRHTRAFADGRRLAHGEEEMNRLYVVESRFSITGTKADHRLRLASRDVTAFALALAKELGVDVPAQQLGEKAAKYLKAIAADLQAAKGEGLVTAGASQPAVVHAAVALVNAALGNKEAVRYVKPFDEGTDGAKGLAELVASMQKGEIETLLVLGGNPVFDAPADLDFAGALGKVAATAHLAIHDDETSEKCGWALNRAHPLEQWSDVRALGGTYSIVQPLIAPLFGGKTDAEAVELVLGGSRKAHELVKETFDAQGFGGGADGWKVALHDGLVTGSAFAAEEPEAAPNGLAEAFAAYKPTTGTEVTFFADAHAWDGRWANNGWLHEMPDHMTKLTWGNAALVSPADAKAQGIVDGDYLEITVQGGKAITIPALVQPGQADGSIALPLGLGRRRIGRVDASDTYTKVGQGVGSDTYPARTSAGLWAASATVRKTGATETMAQTQEHHNMAGRPLARETTLVNFKKDPGFAKEMVEIPEHNGKRFNLYGEFKEFAYDAHKWGMTIDLNSCTGCNACMIACQSENNIPLVGKDGVIRGREMHWIRVDRYFSSAKDSKLETELSDPQAIMQPIGCHHCENAPCELVCPVAATSHSPEGLNDMAYNRCVGTRYCANNCPYKVRRFNFFNYQKDVPELRKMAFNPNVTVRGRGVMEKCSFCVQRIQEAKINAKREQRMDEKGLPRVKDGEVVSACAQTCPAGAITFGDLNDPTSKVAHSAADERAYKLLEEINVRPRVSFLAQVRNPNPALES